ncbi:LPS-assembly lipoprotein LptE [Psychromonas marina]|uniref:LPS-assembly lipoprotein LptE n=1 Tax=Psychromonas marina TaxID=88364 RepID=A0ABQ6DVQ6_9GAMM|nr:LPS assembly lipoprotein LptE [Psychromonas marina]GLS89208.1 LPS-assembly lipoprotein LptE [Psychromonas marina]
MQISFKSFKTLLLLTPLLFLSGCGFHLKHNDGLVEKYPKLLLQSSPNSELTRLIKLRLRGAGIELVTTPSDDIAILKVDNERRSSRIISLNVKAQNAETELGFTLNYSIQSPGYEAQHFNVNLYRDFVESSSQALAKSRESELLTRELRAIAADHIISTMLTLDAKNSAKTDNKSD